MGGRKRVGIGIATRNRREKALQAIEIVKQLSPDSFKTAVVEEQVEIRSSFSIKEKLRNLAV